MVTVDNETVDVVITFSNPVSDPVTKTLLSVLTILCSDIMVGASVRDGPL